MTLSTVGMAFSSSRWRLMVAAVLAATMSAGCRRRDASAATAHAHAAVQARGSVSPRPQVRVVDSALPPGEALRRFREGLPPVRVLDSAGSATSRDELLRRFAAALTRRDTSELRALIMTRAEFGYLYFPESQYIRPPYLMAPDVLWMLMRQRSDRGLRRLVSRLGGDAVTVVAYSCEPSPVVQGSSRLFQECSVRYRRADTDSIQVRRLFGSIIERDGRYKLVSFANDF